MEILPLSVRIQTKHPRTRSDILNLGNIILQSAVDIAHNVLLESQDLER